MPGLLPLYVDIHGGGFILGRPEVDDFYCAHLAETNGICVVAISHRKAPQWRFPTAVDDVSAIILSIIDSDSLPIDRSQVVVGGFSTGGTLALACVQTEYLKGRVKGVVAFSPLTDLSIPVVDKMSTVPANSEPDRLGKDFAELVQQAYVPPKTNLRDPLLSPIYAARSNLPRHIYLVGSELDMLFAEVERMANGLAVEEVGTRLGDEARWTKGTICFEKVKGVRHNFTHISEKAEKEVERKLVVDDLLNRIGVWLCDTVYSQEP
jgi:acetyl esterase/lipase